MKRREAIQYLAGASVSAAALRCDWTSPAILSGGPFAHRFVEPLASAALIAVVLDDRYAAAQRFAKALAGSATACLAARGEAVSLWRDECRPRLPAHPWQLAGMTTYCDFMLLAACARESRGRLVHATQHDLRQPDRPGMLVSWVIASS